MTPKSKLLFEPQLFLAKVGEGRKIADYSKNQVIFSQEDPANTVFYIQISVIRHRQATTRDQE